MRGRVALLLALTALMGGLPRGRELRGMVPARALTVSRTGEEYQVSAALFDQEEGAQARGQELASALARLKGPEGEEVYLGYAGKLLLEEPAARAGVLPVLEYAARDGELGMGVRLYLLREGGTEREEEAFPFSPAVGQTLTALLEDGCAAVPALTGDGQRAYGVLTAGGVAGWLEGEDGLGLEWLRRAAGQTVELPGGGAAQVTRVSNVWQPVRERGRVTGARLVCRMTARTEQVPRKGGTDPAQELAALAGGYIRGTLERLRDWETDCLGLERRMAALSPFSTGVEGGFGGWTMEVQVKVKLTGG